ncbi:hypothetical protein HMPREF0578_1739 [Mobiluncus mulieris 28-1]|nr:hypothetical protein HMPREF0578_1739 [Mobiluncus mulieris 28-1]
MRMMSIVVPIIVAVFVSVRHYGAIGKDMAVFVSVSVVVVTVKASHCWLLC